MSFLCEVLGAYNFFVVKHFELHILYDRCNKKKKFIIIVLSSMPVTLSLTVNMCKCVCVLTELCHLFGPGVLDKPPYTVPLV